MMFLWSLPFMICAIQAAPIARRMVDMSYTFDETLVLMSFAKKFQLNVLRNGTIENGVWIQSEEYSSQVHVGTHMDAPAHFARGGLPVDQIPIDHFIAPAAVIDITAKVELDPDTEATIEDLLHWETITGHCLNETIVLLRSGWGQKWSNATAFLGLRENNPDSGQEFGYLPGTNSSFKLVLPELHFPGLAPTAAQWLVDNRIIYGLGTEAISFDRGMSKDFLSHHILLGNGIFGLENVANVDKIPIYGATLHVLPMKIGKASGAPTRIIATYPEVLFNPSTSA